MSRDCTRDISEPKGVTLAGWLRLLPIVPVLATLLFSSSAYAKGSDRIAGFPAVDLRTGAQYAKAMAVDSAGNIVVVGSVGSGSTDYFIAKFKADGSGLAWLPATYGGTGTDVAAAVAVDSNDNIVVTGYSWNGSNYDVHTGKYNGATGDVMWEHSYNNGAVNGDDWGTGIVLDSSNNVYVAGYSANGVKNDDFLLIKYPAGGGEPAWVQLTDDTGFPNNINRFTAIAAGSSGIAVTGYSSKGGADFDIVTRKYGFDGSLAKEWRYAAPAGRDDRGAAVRMDSAGYVTVTGFITNALNNKDIYTAKYYTASDTPVWERIFDNGGGSGNDEPAGLWIDGLGDVFLTGSTDTLAGNTDIYTVRYSGSTGETLWESTYNAGDGSADVPAGIIVDDALDGGVFVTGYTTVGSTEDFITMKYRKDNGFMLWSTIWNSTFNLSERPVGIALSSRNLVVAGWTDSGATANDFVAMKYDFGSLNAPTNLTAAPASNTSITIRWADNSTNEERFVIQRKLGENGAWADIATVTSPPVPNSVTMDAASMMSYTDGTPPLQSNKYYYYRVRANSTADGDTYYSNEAHALTKVVAYDEGAWNFIYDGADHLEDIATDITFASDNDPVVTGYSDLTEEGLEPGPDTHTWDYMTFKLDRNDSSIKWKARYDSGDGGTDMAAGVALDSSGNVIVTGTAYLSGGSDKSDDLYTRKVQTSTVTDPSVVPDFMWEHQFGTQSGIDFATAISMVRDGSNNSVVLGYGQNASDPMDFDIFIVKLDNNGVPVWTPIIYDSGLNDIPSGIALDPAGNIFVTGFRYDKSDNPEGSYDWFTAKYDGTTGAPVWSDIYNISSDVYQRSSGNDQALGIDVDAAGNAYVTGYATNAAGQTVFYTVKYDGAAVPAGKRRVWEKSFNYTGFDAEGDAIKVDPIDGAVVVAGTAYVSETDSDFHMIRYNPADGSLTPGGLKPFWQINFDRPETSDYVTAMAMDSSGYIYVTGNSRSGPDTDPAFDGTSNVMSLIYDYEGAFLGAMKYEGAGKDEARAVTANYAGEAFIAGSTANAANNPDYLVLKQVNGYLLVPAPFTATPQADYTKVDLGWRHNRPTATFILERTPGPATPVSEWTEINKPAAGSISYTDTARSAGTGYCYRISAIDDTLPSRKTPPVCVTTRLPKPATTTLTVDSTSQITINWSQVTGNTGYKVERKVGAGVWADLVTKGKDQNSHVDTGLTAGTTYSYRVSTNSPSGYSLPGTEPSAVTKPSAPVVNAPTGILKNQMTLNWGAITGASTYSLEYKPASGNYLPFAGCTATTGTSCTVTGLAADTTYLFRVLAANASGSSAWSNEPSGLTLLPEPTLTSINGNSRTQIDLVWTAVAEASGYSIERSSCNYSDSSPTVCTANNNSYYAAWTPIGNTTGATTFSATGLSSGYNYRFRIIATKTGNSSAASNALAAWTWLSPPSTFDVLPLTATSLRLSWSATSGETSYSIERRPPEGAWAVIKSNQGMNTTSFDDTGLQLSTQYCYRMRPLNAGVIGQPQSETYSAEKCKFTPLNAPTLNAPSEVTTTSLTLVWNNIAGNTGYEIQRSTLVDPNYPGSTNWGAWETITIPKLGADIVTYQQSSLTPGYTYRYQVRDTFGTDEYSAWSNAVQATTIPPAPALANPTGTGTNTATISWSDVYGETSFKLERKANADGTWVQLGTAAQNSPSYPESGLAPGITYYYRVRASATSGDSAYSNEKTLLPGPALNPPVVVSASRIDLSWGNVAGNSGYRIERKTGASGSWTLIATVLTDVTTYQSTGLSSGTLYFYRVYANNAAGGALLSNEQSATTTPAVPVVTASTVSDDRIDICWPVIYGATYYRVDRKTGAAGTYEQIANPLVAYGTAYCGEPYPSVTCTTATPTTYCYQDIGLTENTTYYYHVHAGNGTDSAESAEKNATTLSIPGQILTATPLQGGLMIRLDWTPITCTPEACDDPDYFEIQRQMRESYWMPLKTVAASTFTYTDNVAIDPTCKYRYRIRSVKGALKSPYAEVTVHAKPYISGTNVCR